MCSVCSLFSIHIHMYLYAIGCIQYCTIYAVCIHSQKAFSLHILWRAHSIFFFCIRTRFSEKKNLAEYSTYIFLLIWYALQHHSVTYIVCSRAKTHILWHVQCCVFIQYTVYLISCRNYIQFIKLNSRIIRLWSRLSDLKIWCTLPTTICHDR